MSIPDWHDLRRGIVILVTTLVAYHLSLITSSAQAPKNLDLERDTLPFFRGFAVSAEFIGAMQMMFGDYGQYEAALRLNLRNRYFPIVEVGYGKANHEEDVVTKIEYKTQAPYFRVGCDFNVAKNKRSANRVYAGLRYAYTNYKVDISRKNLEDPWWKWPTTYNVEGSKCWQHWAEVVFGVDAKVLGPLHLGWSVRYRRRLFHDDGITGKTWYVPGYGTQDSSNLAATFNVIVDI